MKRAAVYQQQTNYRSSIIELMNLLQSNPQHINARLMLGEIYLTLRDGDNAANQFYKIGGVKQNEIDVRVRLGKALLLKGDYDKIIKEILPPEKNDTTLVSGELLSLRGFAYFFKNDLKQAEQLFSQSLDVDKHNHPAKIGMALLKLKRGEYKAASQFVDQILADDNENMDAWNIKGKLALAETQYESADHAFERIIHIRPTNHRYTFLPPFQAYVFLAQSLVDQQKLTAADQVINTLQKANPKHKMISYLRALVNYTNGNTEKALYHIQIFRSELPSFSPGQLLEGAIQYAQGNFEQGNLVINKYLGNHPHNRTARKLLAASHLNSNQPELSLSLTSLLLEQEPDNPELLLLASSALNNAGKFDAGIMMIQKAVRLQPDNDTIKLKLASAYLASGATDRSINTLQALPATPEKLGSRELMMLKAWSSTKNYTTALAFVDEFIATHPQDSEAHQYSGILLQHMGKTADARKKLKKALVLKPDNVKVLVTLARLEFQEKNYSHSTTLLDELLKIDPKNAHAMYLYAKISVQKGETKKAFIWLERAQQSSATILEPRLVLVKYYLDQGNISSAKKVSTEATEIAPNRADVWSIHSAVQNKSGETRSAIDSLRKAEKLKPESEVIILNLARLLISVDDIPDALNSLHKLMELSPDNFQAAGMLALIEIKKGNTQQALDIAKKQQSFKNNRLNALVLEGNLHRIAKEYKKAVNAYRTAADIYMDAPLCLKLYTASRQAGVNSPERILLNWLKEHPENTAIRQTLINHYETKNNIAKIIQEYEILITHKPDDAAILNNLALAYYSKKNQKAVKTAEKAHDLNKDNAAIKDTLGWILLNEKNIKRGFSLLREAHTLLPNNPDVIYHYAVALDKSGHRDDARTKLQNLINSKMKFPSQQQAKKYLESLAP
jgi:putative PEP-CTERM system TPR-repeat lipoprotein